MDDKVYVRKILNVILRNVEGSMSAMETIC